MATLGPLVTVVIPTRNRSALVQQAIASVEAQTYPNWELVVVDDGSTDGSVDILRSRSHERLQVISLGDGDANASWSSRVSRARNTGVAAGSGDLIAFLDSDDLWLSRRLELGVEALRSSGARWCYGRMNLIDPSGVQIPLRAGNFDPKKGAIVEALLKDETFAAVGSLLVERTLFDEVGGFDESPRQHLREDADLVLRLATSADAAVVDEPVQLLREHPGRSTHSFGNPFQVSAAVFGKFLLSERDPHLRRLARARLVGVLAEGGRYYLRRGKLARAASLLTRALLAGLRG